MPATNARFLKSARFFRPWSINSAPETAIDSRAACLRLTRNA